MSRHRRSLAFEPVSAVSTSIVRASAIAATLAAAGPLAAQTTDSVPATGEPDVGLVFEREVFSYPATAERDPFSPLLGVGFGPRFEELELLGIIHSAHPDASIVLLTDPDQRIHRVRTNEQVGNARLLEIEPHRVIFAVNHLGTVRREHLELPRPAIHLPR